MASWTRVTGRHPCKKKWMGRHKPSCPHADTENRTHITYFLPAVLHFGAHLLKKCVTHGKLNQCDGTAPCKKQWMGRHKPSRPHAVAQRIGQKSLTFCRQYYILVPTFWRRCNTWQVKPAWRDGTPVKKQWMGRHKPSRPSPLLG